MTWIVIVAAEEELKPRAMVQSLCGYAAALPSSLTGTADDCDLCKNAQSLDFCMVNLYKLEPSCEILPQQRDALKKHPFIRA